jgi:rhodanese-related sulfurtransferase
LLALAALLAVPIGLWHPLRPPAPFAAGAKSIRPPVPQRSLEELRREPRFARALWIDARPAEAFARGHVPGALHLTEQAWENGLPAVIEAWRPENPIVVYCGGETCATSQSVAQRLRLDLAAETIFVLQGGWEAWSP